MGEKWRGGGRGFITKTVVKSMGDVCLPAAKIFHRNFAGYIVVGFIPSAVCTGLTGVIYIVVPHTCTKFNVYPVGSMAMHPHTPLQHRQTRIEGINT